MTQAKRAYQIIEERIVTLQLKPGQIVSENELSKQFQIGRMPIREALKKLESANLVVALPRKGVMVKDITTEEMLQQLEVRAVLERLIVESATRFLDKNEKQRLLELADEYEEATQQKDAIKTIHADNEFNELIGKASRNPYAWNAICPLHVVGRRNFYLHYYLDEELTTEISNAHINLMKIMVTGDVAKALEQLNYLLQCIKKLNCLRINLLLAQR